jgi:16S rRNA (guanine527-N7)-methyltransferase
MSWEEVVVATFEAGQDRSIVGPGDVRVHIQHAERLAAALEPPAHAADLGSGAGIPGLVLAGIWPESRWLLVDAARRRTQLLDQAVTQLGWGDRVTVAHARAEALGRSADHRARYDLVTARSFGPPAVTAECAAPLLALGGVLAVSEPPDPPPGRWSSTGLAPLGLELLAPEPGLQRLVAVRPPDARFPRRPGVADRRPLF